MLKWVTTSSLGTIDAGYISELAVSSTQTLTISEIKYTLSNGALPAGLTLQHDGTITGKVSYNTTGTYTFTVTAIDNANTEELDQTFTLNVAQTSTTKFTEIYVRPYLKPDKRNKFNEFISNNQIFDPSLIYRPYDKNFGVQRQMKMVLDFGIQQLNLEEFLYPLQENFYKKRLRLGEIKSAIAKNSTGTHIYDVIYVEVVDELVNNSGISVSPVIHSVPNDELYYPGSVDNMRRQLRTITLQNWTTVSVRENMQPKYMMTQQVNDTRTQTYMRVVPLCYTIPGKSKVIINRIKSTGFKFNTFDFEVDRIIVENSLDNNTAKYLIFDRKAAGNLLDIDAYLFGPEGWIRLDDESDRPLERE